MRVTLQFSDEKKTKNQPIADAAGAEAAIDACNDIATTVTKNADTSDNVGTQVATAATTTVSAGAGAGDASGGGSGGGAVAAAAGGGGGGAVESDNITVGEGRLNDEILRKYLHPVGMFSTSDKQVYCTIGVTVTAHTG